MSVNYGFWKLVPLRPIFIISGILLILVIIHVCDVDGRAPRPPICKMKFTECMSRKIRRSNQKPSKSYCEHAMLRRYNCKKIGSSRTLPDPDMEDFEYDETKTTTTPKSSGNSEESTRAADVSGEVDDMMDGGEE